MRRVLFVCTGNTCRSPMAAAILAHLAKTKSYPLEVKSAGIYAMSGEEMSPQARMVLSSRGMDSTHSSQKLDHSLLEWAELILTMTEQHKQHILQQSPSSKEKCYSLTEYIADSTGDISDPYGASVEVYGQCADYLHQHLEKIIEKWIKELDKE